MSARTIMQGARGAGAVRTVYAPSPFMAGELRNEYDGAALLYELHGVFLILFQGQQLKPWKNDRDRNGPDPARDFWRQIGRNAIQERLQFVRDANGEVGAWYNRTLNYAVAVFDGILSAQEAVVRELLSWGDGIPTDVARQATADLDTWAQIGREAQAALRTANGVLQRQLAYNGEVLTEATRFADTLHENYESEVNTLRQRVRELEAEVMRLLDENNKLRDRIAQLEAEARKFGLRLPSAQQWKKIALIGGGLLGLVTGASVLSKLLRLVR